MSDKQEKRGFLARVKEGLTGAEAAAEFAAAEGYIEDKALAPWQHVELSEADKQRLFDRLVEGLSRTGSQLGSGLGTLLLGKKTIDDALLEEIETRLLMADVGVEATRDIIAVVTLKLSRSELSDDTALLKTLQDEMAALLLPVEAELNLEVGEGPFVLLMVGVNGAGKTTTIGKLAQQFQAGGKSVMLAAGDTFRAAAVEQLQAWGDRNGVPVVAQQTGADSASVIFDAVQSARAKGIDVLIADTAGRLHNKDNLMEELKKVVRVIQKQIPDAPHEVMLVLDGGTGQNALAQAQHFHAAVGVTGITVTKLDGTARGGMVFAVSRQLGLPIRFIGVGEKIGDLRPFRAREFVAALFSGADSAL